MYEPYMVNATHVPFKRTVQMLLMRHQCLYKRGSFDWEGCANIDDPLPTSLFGAKKAPFCFSLLSLFFSLSLSFFPFILSPSFKYHTLQHNSAISYKCRPSS